MKLPIVIYISYRIALFKYVFTSLLRTKIHSIDEELYRRGGKIEENEMTFKTLLNE